ncbi:chymotrypsin-1-like [Zophobas morio]|uniref:chymotrypsin-1-like n=1 Tax=Zophobas morio TaxID=2755281 RepID=UPI003083A01E
MYFLKKFRLSLALFFVHLWMLTWSLNPNEKIIGGKTAEPGQFPFIVSFQFYSNGFDHYICDACILNKQWILTAAQCFLFIQVDEMYIVAGTNQPNIDGIRYNVSKVIQYPEFNISSTNYWHDIGLAKIDGWTLTKDADPLPLEYAEVTALSTEDCLTLGEGSEINDRIPRGPGQVCAFSPTTGVGGCCTGAGVPLVCNNTLVGLDSYSLDNLGSHGYPDFLNLHNYELDFGKLVLLQPPRGRNLKVLSRDSEGPCIHTASANPLICKRLIKIVPNDTMIMRSCPVLLKP